MGTMGSELRRTLPRAPAPHIMPVTSGPAATQLDATLVDMRNRYGAGVERIARLGLEYDPPHVLRP